MMMREALISLMRVDLIDDDQTLMLMAYKENKEKFKLNTVNPADWFVIFKDFNK
jgi:hypothetical protein